MRRNVTWMAAALLLAAAQARATGSLPAVVWTDTFAGWGTSGGACVQQVSDGYIVVGNTSSSDSTPRTAILLAKVSSSGTKVWQKVIKAYGEIHANSVLQTTDGGYVVAGMGTLAQGATARVCLIKTDGGATYRGNIPSIRPHSHRAIRWSEWMTTDSSLSPNGP